MDFKSLKRRGFMLVLSSPSGAGKTTITREVLKRDRKISLSVSATTREQRPGEEDGVHYHFKSQEEFKKMRENDELLEAANVFGNWYGTPKKAVTEALEKGGDVMFDIDWQGSQQLKENAIDCQLNKKINLYSKEYYSRIDNNPFENKEIIDSQNNKRIINLYDKDFSEQCNFKLCNYQCNAIPDKDDEIQIDYSTYSIDFGNL